jgi:hypothetical protein
MLALPALDAPIDELSAPLAPAAEPPALTPVPLAPAPAPPPPPAPPPAPWAKAFAVNAAIATVSVALSKTVDRRFFKLLLLLPRLCRPDG